MRNGQSVDAIIANNPELFAKYARSTIYGWIEDGLFSSKKHNLPFAGTRRKPHKKPEIKTNAKCRVGRTYEDMTEWLKEHPHVIPTEADTVIDSISGKVKKKRKSNNLLTYKTLRLAAPCGPSGSLRSGNPTTSSRAHLDSALKPKICQKL